MTAVKVFGFTMDHRHHAFTGEQWRVDFPNGYGASVVRGPYSYGGPEGKYELAVFHGESLCYATPITDDVLGWLGKGEVASRLRAITRLEAQPDCTHERAE